MCLNICIKMWTILIKKMYNNSQKPKSCCNTSKSLIKSNFVKIIVINYAWYFTMQVSQHWKKSLKNETVNYNSVSREIAINSIDPAPFSQEDTRPEEIADSPWGTDVCFHHYLTQESPAGRQTEADWCAMGRWRVNRKFLWKSSPRNVEFSHGPLYCVREHYVKGQART